MTLAHFFKISSYRRSGFQHIVVTFQDFIVLCQFVCDRDYFRDFIISCVIASILRISLYHIIYFKISSYPVVYFRILSYNVYISGFHHIVNAIFQDFIIPCVIFSGFLIIFQDFIVSCVIVALWLISASAWAQGLTDLKYYTDLSECGYFHKLGANVCGVSNQYCSQSAFPNFAELNVSIVSIIVVRVSSPTLLNSMCPL